MNLNISYTVKSQFDHFNFICVFMDDQQMGNNIVKSLQFLMKQVITLWSS